MPEAPPKPKYIQGEPLWAYCDNCNWQDYSDDVIAAAAEHSQSHYHCTHFEPRAIEIASLEKKLKALYLRAICPEYFYETTSDERDRMFNEGQKICARLNVLELRWII